MNFCFVMFSNQQQQKKNMSEIGNFMICPWTLQFIQLSDYGYDAYIFYAEADGKACQDDIKILKERSTVPELKIALYKDLPLEELPIERRMAYILENCRLLLFYVTSSFTADTLKIFQKDMCLSHVIEERSYRAFPLWKKPKDGKEEVPLDLKAIEGLDLWKLTGTVDEQQSFIEKFDRRFREERKRKP